MRQLMEVPQFLDENPLGEVNHDKDYHLMMKTGETEAPNKK